jgi:predicted DNA binding protein
MREVSMTWDRESLKDTDLGGLDPIVNRLVVMGNLLISDEGTRQIILPEYKEGKSAEDLNKLKFFNVEQHVNERDSTALIVWNDHPLVCMAATNENIHVLVPTEYHEGALTLTARGLPKSIADFVRASKMFFPPASINVRDVIEERAGLSDVLTPRQFECFQLAVKHGFYNEPKEITLQGLSQVMDIARSTFQEHLQSAEQTVLRWVGEQSD